MIGLTQVLVEVLVNNSPPHPLSPLIFAEL